MSKQPWYIEHSPEMGQAFKDFHDACQEKGVLDKKTKELLMLALACAFRCPHCTEDHIKRALDAGCSKQEVTETLLITAIEGAGTQLAWTKETYKEYLGE
ncbi:MAG: carboxymuconolactone decarboxylase family protein [Candidatus Sumerlaeota bacterium]